MGSSPCGDGGGQASDTIALPRADAASTPGGLLGRRAGGAGPDRGYRAGERSVVSTAELSPRRWSPLLSRPQRAEPEPLRRSGSPATTRSTVSATAANCWLTIPRLSVKARPTGERATRLSPTSLVTA